MIRRTPIKRSGPPRKKRPGPPRAGRLEGDDLTGLRDDCFARDFGICQAMIPDGRTAYQCGTQTFKDLPHTAPNSYHMAHVQGKRRGGDSLQNVKTFCGDCHRKFHNFGPSMQKPCKSKRELL
jgi:5-methylcytosine-specific restriction endonuclease McrA